MDFGLSEEQQLLEQTLRRYLEEEVATTRVREICETETAHDPSLWSGLAELGIAGILIPEQHGGSGLTLLDAAVAAESLGWGVTPVPFLGSAVMAPLALMSAGSEEQQSEWLPELASGRRCIGVAATELFSIREGAGISRESDGKLGGKALLALDSGAADAFLVPVGTNSLALVARGAPGLSVENLTTIDQTRRVAELVFDAVQPDEWIGGEGGAATAIEEMVDGGRLTLAADVLGASEHAIEMSVEYAKQREQFGRVIGSFQAVKHMCAEMIAELEPARSLVWYAAHAFDSMPEEGALMAAHAKAHLCEIGTQIVRVATEVHGGIGFTAEHDLHLWFKRVGLDRQLLGGPDLLRERAARLQGWAE
jgi:alkylation response protein AidB-like acyl-CoA dehydrogenase